MVFFDVVFSTKSLCCSEECVGGENSQVQGSPESLLSQPASVNKLGTHAPGVKLSYPLVDWSTPVSPNLNSKPLHSPD